MKFSNILNEIKNRHYVEDKLIIVENVEGNWGYKVFNKHGRLIKTNHSELYTKEMALELAKNFVNR